MSISKATVITICIANRDCVTKEILKIIPRRNNHAPDPNSHIDPSDSISDTSVQVA